jgi:hypothetical protein
MQYAYTNFNTFLLNKKNAANRKKAFEYHNKSVVCVREIDIVRKKVSKLNSMLNLRCLTVRYCSDFNELGNTQFLEKDDRMLPGLDVLEDCLEEAGAG